MMSQGPWLVLGIDPTHDASSIRKAYASALKRHRPEEDPEGFQAITDAYEWAIAQARRTTPLTKSTSPPHPGEAPSPGDDRHNENAPNDGAPPPPQSPAPALPRPHRAGRERRAPRMDVPAFLEELRRRIKKDDSRQLSGWLVAHPDLFDIDQKSQLRNRVLRALTTNIEELAPSRAQLDVILEFFGIDGRMARDPTHSQELLVIERYFAPRPVGYDPAYAQSDLPPQEDFDDLMRHASLAVGGQARLFTVDQGRILLLVLGAAPRWRLLVGFLMLGRVSETARLLELLAPRLERLVHAGVSMPNLGFAKKLADPVWPTREYLIVAGWRLGVALSVLVPCGALLVLLTSTSESGNAGASGAIPIMVGGAAGLYGAATLAGIAFRILRLALGFAAYRWRRYWSTSRWELFRVSLLLTSLAAAWSTIALVPSPISVALGWQSLLLAGINRFQSAMLMAVGFVIGIVIADENLAAFDLSATERLLSSFTVAGATCLVWDHLRDRERWKRPGPPFEGWRRVVVAAWLIGFGWLLAWFAL